MLERAQEKEARLQELKKTSAAAAAAEQWKDTLQQATGAKVMDDQVKLKRAIKARENSKKKARVEVTGVASKGGKVHGRGHVLLTPRLVGRASGDARGHRLNPGENNWGV